MQIQLEPNLSAEEFIGILRRSTLAERRPVDQPERIAKMLQQADLIATARDSEGELVGIARAITDYAYCTYLSDLAVDQSFQGQGIGRQLIDFVHRTAGIETRLILLAAPAAASYYPHIGMHPHPSCWTFPPHEKAR